MKTIIILILNLIIVYSNNNEIINKLLNTINITKSILISIEKRWDIYNYPLFLKSVAMPLTSWNILKLKYQQKIVNRFLYNTSDHNFVISFMGSSVTAGKDRHINYSFPSLIGPVMNDAFNSIGIKLVIRNVAMANNPCIPYDLCVKTFTGHDADIIHWEQSYNCDSTNSNVAPILEQFLRQSIVNKKNHPVVVFSESDTPNWSKDQCVHKQENRRLDKIYSTNNELNHLITRNDLTSPEKELLSLLYSSPNRIPTSFNKGNLNSWGAITPILQDYKTLGIQLWNHGHYVAYKCRGPYVPDWDCCNGYEWHPSIRGHELRAAHYAYFWLLIYLEALESIYQTIHHNNIELNMLHHITNKHIYQEIKFIPDVPIYPSNYSDNIQCYTSFIPIYDKTKHLIDLIVKPIDKQVSNKPPFDKINIDMLNMKSYEYADIFKYEYKDRKYVLYGNSSSSPLQLSIVLNQLGYIHICQAPSVWGKIPDSFVSLWNSNTLYYLSNHTSTLDNEVVFASYDQDALNQCIQSVNQINPGSYILTIQPRNESNIMIAYLLLP